MMPSLTRGLLTRAHTAIYAMLFMTYGFAAQAKVPSTEITAELGSIIKDSLLKAPCSKSTGPIKIIMWFDAGYAGLKYQIDFGKINILVIKDHRGVGVTTVLLPEPYSRIDENLRLLQKGYYLLPEKRLVMKCY